MLQSLLRRLEVVAQRHQGKGWGSSTVGPETAALAKLLPSSPTVLDVGGNVGDWSAAILKQTNPRRLLIVEPDAGNLRKLQTRFEGDQRIEVIEGALSTGDGTARLFGDQAGSGLASLHQRDLRHAGIPHELLSTVRTMSLATLLETHGIETVDLLKMDIEGHEYAVLSAAQSILPKVALIQFEFGGCNVDSRTYFRDFWHLLSPSFSIWRLAPSGLVEVKKYRERDEVFTTTNYLAIRRSAAA